MAYYLSPFGNTPVTVGGVPVVGGSIKTYLAGTSTPETTYTDNTGGTSQGVSMTLDANGLPENGPVWMLGGVPLKFRFFNAAGVSILDDQDDISGIGDIATASDEWVLYGAAPTYISATSFSVVGDQTNTFQVLRRLKSTNSGGTTFSTIATSAFAAGVTTVTVTNTSGTLDSGMSAVSYGLLSATNPSIPESAAGKLLRTVASKPVLQVIEATPYTTVTSAGTAAIFDDTIPQISEGTSLPITATITPTSTTSRLRIEFEGFFGTVTDNISIWVAMFQDSTANAVMAGNATGNSANLIPIRIVHEMAAGTTSATTFSIRFGSQSSTAYINAIGAGPGTRKFGGILKATMRVTEIAA